MLTMSLFSGFDIDVFVTWLLLGVGRGMCPNAHERHALSLRAAAPIHSRERRRACTPRTPRTMVVAHRRWLADESQRRAAARAAASVPCGRCEGEVAQGSLRKWKHGTGQHDRMVCLKCYTEMSKTRKAANARKQKLASRPKETTIPVGLNDRRQLFCEQGASAHVHMHAWPWQTCVISAHTQLPRASRRPCARSTYCRRRCTRRRAAVLCCAHTDRHPCAVSGGQRVIHQSAPPAPTRTCGGYRIAIFWRPLPDAEACIACAAAQNQPWCP